MQKKQHAVRVESEIRRSIAASLVSNVRRLAINLVGEVVVDGKTGPEITTKGEIQVRGEVCNVHMQQKLLNAVREHSGGRTVSDHTTVKLGQNPLARKGFF